MPFPKGPYQFAPSVLGRVNEVGAVYGLFSPTPFRPGSYDCLYVGETDNLRRRLVEHYNNPPISGVTHFFVEEAALLLRRKAREKQLIAEFNPPGNKTRGG